jgi:tetratricopeptide (TPR) repeat protein
MTGIGKTALAERLAAHFFSRDVAPTPPYIQVVLDRGVSSPDFTRGAIAILQAMGDDTAQQLPDVQILPYLLKALTQNPCWLQLDSLEFLLRQDDHGEYHFIDPTWTDFFCQCLNRTDAMNPVSSRIILTSQALPMDLQARCDRLSNLWHDYPLRGLAEQERLDLFRHYGVGTRNSTEEHYLCQIAQHFEGHPLILKMIAGDIGKPLFGGSVTKYWQRYYSQQSRPKLHQSQEQRARNWVNQTLQQLPAPALHMLQRCAVFRRAVPESFYRQMVDGDFSLPPAVQTQFIASLPPPADPTAALTTLKARYLVEEADIQNGELLLRQHNLIREEALTQLKADHPAWEAAERQAAHLWLTAYQPTPDAPSLETVRGELEAFDHYCAVKAWEAAKAILLDQQIGLRLQTWGNYKEMIVAHQKLIGHLQPTDEVACTKGLGNAYYLLSNYPQAIASYEKSLDLAREIGDRQGEGNSLGNLGNAYDSLGQYERAIDYHQQSLAIKREIGNRQGEGNSLGGLGNAYDSLGQYERAIDYHQQYLTISREIGDRQGEGNSLGNLGNAYDGLGQYERAIDLYQQRLTISREIGDRAGEGRALGNLGNAYNSLGQYERAIDYHQQYLTISREIGDRNGEAISLGNLGSAYCALGDYSKALELQEQKLAIARKLQRRTSEAYALSGLGEVFIKLEQYADALKALQSALEICQETGERFLEAEALKNLAELHQALGEVEVARQFCQQALALAQELGIPLAAECEALQLKMENEGSGT